jgi:hypothetical protein
MRALVFPTSHHHEVGCTPVEESSALQRLASGVGGCLVGTWGMRVMRMKGKGTIREERVFEVER